MPVSATSVSTVPPGPARAVTFTRPPSGVYLQADSSADLPAVLADRDRLSQILINVVDNAVAGAPRRAPRAGP